MPITYISSKYLKETKQLEVRFEAVDKPGNILGNVFSSCQSYGLKRRHTRLSLTLFVPKSITCTQDLVPSLGRLGHNSSLPLSTMGIPKFGIPSTGFNKLAAFELMVKVKICKALNATQVKTARKKYNAVNRVKVTLAYYVYFRDSIFVGNEVV